jgi:hypothetical protein
LKKACVSFELVKLFKQGAQKFAASQFCFLRRTGSFPEWTAQEKVINRFKIKIQKKYFTSSKLTPVHFNFRN